MAAIGAKYKWKEGKILHASRLWKSPTRRRIPRLLIEDRALEVGILLHIEEPWFIFEETKMPSAQIQAEKATQLQFYLNRYYLLPVRFAGEDTYEFLHKNSLLLWGINGKYFVKAVV